jgi:hypothetical protein
MANGLDLAGLEGLTFDSNQGGLVNATEGPDGFTLTSVIETATAIDGGAELPFTLNMISSHGEKFVNSTQTVHELTANFSSFSTFTLPVTTTNMKLVGWNQDGLLFSEGQGLAGSYFFVGTSDGSFTPDGMPANTLFTTNTSSQNIPFGLTAISSVVTPCFAAGTLIGTPDHAIAVEKLKEGDVVQTLSGTAKEIKWIGNRRVNCRNHPRPNEVMPVRIKAQAFGENLPQRDLLVSPGHSIYVDGVLIPAGFLVNGATVVQDDVEYIHYYHIELDAHDVVLAEGLPAESYLDDENRHAFNNGATYMLRPEGSTLGVHPEGSALGAHPDLDPTSWENACAPRVMAGPQLTEVKQRLIDQADSLGYHLSDEAAVHLTVDGEKVEPCHSVGMRHWFIVPANATEVRLNSNSGVPMQLIADHGDSRRLGVAVSELKVDGNTLALEAVFASNPHAIETHGAMPWIWTDGSAVLSIDLPASATTMVEVAIVMAMKSWNRKPNLSVVRAFDALNAG